MLLQRVQLVCDVGVGMLHCPSQPCALTKSISIQNQGCGFFSFLLPGKVEMLFFLLCVSGVLLAEFFTDLHFPKSPKH